MYIIIKGSFMGKGDQRSKKGKIFRGTFGKKRPSKIIDKNKANASKKVK